MGHRASGELPYSGDSWNGCLRCRENLVLHNRQLVLYLAYAVNVTVIGNGQLDAYSIHVPASSAAGAAAFPHSSVILASPAGNAVATTMGAPFSPTILARQGVNGDGVVNTVDVQLMSTQAIASQSNPAACIDDQNGDGNATYRMSLRSF